MKFPTLTGFKLTFKLQVIGKWMENYVQILHCRGCHRITVSTISCQEEVVNIYDSMFTDADDETKKIYMKCLMNLAFHFHCQRCKGTNDCGLFAITFTTNLCLNINIF